MREKTVVYFGDFLPNYQWGGEIDKMLDRNHKTQHDSLSISNVEFFEREFTDHSDVFPETGKIVLVVTDILGEHMLLDSAIKNVRNVLEEKRRFAPDAFTVIQATGGQDKLTTAQIVIGDLHDEGRRSQLADLIAAHL